jgi:branched-subunit amino acid transport protein
MANRPLPPAADASLRHIGPAALAALLATMALTSAGEVEPLPAGRLLAIAAGLVAVRRTGKVFAAFAVGLPVAWAAAAAGL